MNRRSFLKNVVATGALSSITGNLNAGSNASKQKGKAISPNSSAPTNLSGSPFRIGVESQLPGPEWWATVYGRLLGETYDEDMWARSLHELGAEFTLFYDSISPAKPKACHQITDMCQRHNMDFLFNNTYGDIYGPWLPGTGRAEYSDEQLAYAQKAKQFRGIILDEVEHRQIHQIDTGRAAYLADVKNLTLQEAYEKVLASAKSIADRYRKFGGNTVAEQVFPVMSHVFARAGMIPAPKFLSFSYPSVYFAVAAGAAMQYGTEMWVVHDFWGAEPFWGQVGVFAPGFSPEAFRSSLLLAYWLGADAAYTEALHNLIIIAKSLPEEQRLMTEHKLPHRKIDRSEWYYERKYHLNAYGKLHRWFAKSYVPTHPRSYTFRDIKPRVAIIHFPDSLWATLDKPRIVPFRGLYGPIGPKADQRHASYLDAWHLLTHGAVSRDGISIYADESLKGFLAERDKRALEIDDTPDRANDYPYADRYPFCPVDSVLVFDHLVGEQHLRDAELLILTGEMVSEPTLQAVLRRIEAGAECLTLEHLAPIKIRRPGATCPYEIQAGRGRFVVVSDFRNEASENTIRRHLGPSDRIRYRFGDQVVSIRQAEGYSCNLINEADFPNSRH